MFTSSASSEIEVSNIDLTYIWPRFNIKRVSYTSLAITSSISLLSWKGGQKTFNITISLCSATLERKVVRLIFCSLSNCPGFSVKRKAGKEKRKIVGAGNSSCIRVSVVWEIQMPCLQSLKCNWKEKGLPLYLSSRLNAWCKAFFFSSYIFLFPTIHWKKSGYLFLFSFSFLN